jgi:small subunit ribosomal protein S17
MEKSAIVVVTSSWSHPLYSKIIRRSKKYLVHNELLAKPGQTVTLQEIRPLSKNKHFAIIKILKKENS